MEALLGFELDFSDYLTFLTLVLVVYVWLAGLPGRIVIARQGHCVAKCQSGARDMRHTRATMT
jgi:hypothetical protein